MSILLLSAAIVLGQVPSADEELKEHLANLTRQVEDESRPLLKRIGVLLDIAATLDRAAQAAGDQEKALVHWRDAVSRLDAFADKIEKEDPETVAPLRLQAGVYVWAQGRSWADRMPEVGDLPDVSNRARAYFNDARERLEKAVAASKELPVVQDNARYRLARTLVDLAELERTDAAKRKAFEADALAKLEAPFDGTSAAAGFALLLKAELLRKVGRIEEAAKAVELVEQRMPIPPESVLLPTVVSVLIDRTRFVDAIARIDASSLSVHEKAVLKVKVRLAQRGRMNAGSERIRVEDQAIKDAAPLRDRPDRASRETLVALADAVDMPGVDSDPSEFDLLSEGHLIAQRPERAAALLGRGAERAAKLGDPAKAAAFRLRAGATLFRIPKYKEAETFFKAVVDDPKAGAARPKASLLVVLGRDKGSTSRPPIFKREAYVEALRSHIAGFPDDPTTAEARWLLGRELRRAGKVDEANKLWAAIPPSSPRWFDVRTLIADELLATLTLTLNAADPAEYLPAAKALRTYLEESIDQAPTSESRGEFVLRAIRVDLLPTVARPEKARDRLEEFLKHETSNRRQSEARLLLIVALAEAGRIVEAESRARVEARAAQPDELLPALRLLDHAASEADSDLSRIRDAAILKILITPTAAKGNEIPERLRAEYKLRQARAHALAGEIPTARGIITSTTFNPEELNDEGLRDLADLYMRVEGYSLAIDVERIRAQRLPKGTGSWFEARYALAMAYYRAKKFADARQIIDATAILHPNLGGPALKAKFERLRSRLNES